MPAEKPLRLRVFAGPNGSGKSTILKELANYDIGHYVNADDLATLLRKSYCDFTKYKLSVTPTTFKQIALESGLVNDDFSSTLFLKSYSLRKNIFRVKTTDDQVIQRIAQILADALRKLLLESRQRFSFETVFSHSSKLDIMKAAAAAGYKVYLYFISTSGPTVNVDRVKKRVAQNGHGVPEEKIISRYFRSMELLYDASQIAYQAYFFDNSQEEGESKMFAHFKKTNNKKIWDKANKANIPEWFKKYYSSKISKNP
ncbi:zeta toxin family protein [Niabella beijingensis]|uniref:zeta toxin family protein n=1 Tax=Niabella beijingensis TaxID=2872700 RepID=UPI001CBEDD4F|nr:AAA family ATPase [Niabella beijingensis]MBZ4188960.1 zeta toxin family protein [Niabella beijingensis]